jgi:lactoylglutathione lyase
MNLAKPHVDVGLFARSIERQQAFWSDRVGLPYDHRLKLGAGIHQHRFHLNGSVLKVNHAREPLAEQSPSGITRVRIASADTTTPLRLADPDGNGVTLVPPGYDGITGIGIDLRVNDRDAHERFWRYVMQFASPAPDVYVCGDTRIFVCEHASVERTQSWRGYGWRYLTVQVTDCQAEHDGVLARGGDEGEPPRRLGDVAVVSFVRDPDGNFIELSQRASLVGSL